jgi:small subunit ribosomal protein S2
VALIDTDANPEVIDYPIPGNDDSIKSVKYVTSKLVEAINEELTNVKEEAQDLLSKKSADDESGKEEENPAEDKDQKKSTRKNKQKKVDHSS